MKAITPDFFSDFDAVTSQEWKDKIIADLKGKPFENLIWKTEEGFDLPPFQTKEDLQKLEYLQNIESNTFDDSADYLSAKQWKNRQLIKVISPKEANEKALLALNNGCDAICFDLSDFKITTEINFTSLLKDIATEACGISYCISVAPNDFLKELKNFLDAEKGTFTAINGSLILSQTDLLKKETNLSEVIRFTESATDFRVISVSHSENKQITEKIADILSNTTEIIELLLQEGISLESVLKNIELRYEVSNNYFFEIAAVQVIRMLFSEIAFQFGAKNYQAASLQIHINTQIAIDEERKKNPYTNMLSNTTQAMSAIIGGCNSLSVLPHNQGIEDVDNFSERIARNVSNILKEEAYFDKVNNPVAGSYYIGSLIDQLAEKSWEKFQAKQLKN